MIALLIRPSSLSRPAQVFVVVGMTFLVGWLYVATSGVVTFQIFYLCPIILAVAWLGLGWGVAVAVLSAVLRLGGDYINAESHFDFFASSHLLRISSNRLSTLLVHFVVALVIHELIALSRQLEERVQTRTIALRQAVAARERLQSSLFEAGVRERGEIGRDLHDGLGQHLTATAMAARVLATRLRSRDDPLAADAQAVESLVTSGIDQTRKLARGLLLESVPPEQLCAELEELAVTASRQYRIPCTVFAEGAVERLDVNAASHLFYIAREALRNAMRHSGATRVSIRLEAGDESVELAVQDNGKGMALAADAAGMGLHIMRQRAEFMGGELRINHPPGKGTRVECSVPLTVPA